MHNFLPYMVKVSAGTGFFWLLYILVFNKDTFYLRNRIYLIFSLLTPLLLPLLRISAKQPEQETNVSIIVSQGSSQFQSLPQQTPVTQVTHMDMFSVIFLVYCIIAFFFLIHYIISIASTCRIINKGKKLKTGFPGVVITEQNIAPFSFFPYAVIPEEYYKDDTCSDILEHEFAHLRLYHTFDLLLAELFIVMQWFNPFVWLIKKSILLNHEYQADQISVSNKADIKEYQYRLLNFQPEIKSISLAHNFNSSIKNRITMLNKKPSGMLASVKNIIILPALAFGVFTFATPVYHPSTHGNNTVSKHLSQSVQQKEVRGTVLDESGKPLEGVFISSTGTMGHAGMGLTDEKGNFNLRNLEDDAMINFNARGYKQQTIKAVFDKEMSIKLVRDPEYLASFEKGNQDIKTRIATAVDDKITNESPSDILSRLRVIGATNQLSSKEAIEKYGDAGKNGVMEFYSVKKAMELNLLPKLNQNPNDLPAFQGKSPVTFNDWVIAHTKYPSEASAKGISGNVTVNFSVEPDGTISNVNISGQADPSLSEAVIKTIKSSPRWDPPKNPGTKETFSSMVTLFFEAPDKIRRDRVYVMVEQMPEYPGGDAALLGDIANNLRYPEAAKASKTEGMVIIRFVVDTNGKIVEPNIIKGVNPSLDAEAVRVVGLLKRFTPGMQSGKVVQTYYMVPVKFSLDNNKQLFSKDSESQILRFLAMNTGYPEAAKNSLDTGKIYVYVKIGKGGTQVESREYSKKEELHVPLLHEIVVVGYKPSSPDIKTSGNKEISEHPLLKSECHRVVSKLTEIKLTEWKDKDVEFALIINFTLK